MIFKIKNKHHSMFRLLSSSRSYRVTFEKFYIYILYKIVHNKLMHLFHYIGEILYYPSNYAGKKNIIDHFTKYLPRISFIISIGTDLS